MAGWVALSHVSRVLVLEDVVVLVRVGVCAWAAILVGHIATIYPLGV